MKRVAFPILMLLIAHAVCGEAGKDAPAPDVPACLAPLIEIHDGLPCLPRGVERIRILANKTVVLATWGDLKRRQGRDPNGKIVWIRGETVRDPARGLREVGGKVMWIDAVGRCWYRPALLENQTYYMMVEEKGVRRFDLDGLARHPPFETAPGQVWIETYAGLTNVDPMGKVHDFRFCLLGETPPAKRKRQIYGRYGAVRHCDGSVLLFPETVGTLTTPGNPASSYSDDMACDRWAWYLPRGDLTRAKKVPLPRRLIGAVAPLPDGSFRFELYTRGVKKPDVFRWHPLRGSIGPKDIYGKATRVQAVTVLGSDDIHILLRFSEPPETKAVLQRFNARRRVEVLHRAMPVRCYDRRGPEKELVPTLELEDGWPAAVLPGGRLMFCQCCSRKGLRPGGLSCPILVHNGRDFMFPLQPADLLPITKFLPGPARVYELDDKGRLYYYHSGVKRLVILSDTSRPPYAQRRK